MYDSGNTKGGIITVALTSCLTRLESAVWQLAIFLYLQNRLLQTSQKGGQRYSDTSPFSIIPCTVCWTNRFEAVDTFPELWLALAKFYFTLASEKTVMFHKDYSSFWITNIQYISVDENLQNKHYDNLSVKPT